MPAQPEHQSSGRGGSNLWYRRGAKREKVPRPQITHMARSPLPPPRTLEVGGGTGSKGRDLIYFDLRLILRLTGRLGGAQWLS